MTTRRNGEWTDEDFATLARMLDAGDNMPAIARVLKRSQIDVAAKAFSARQGRADKRRGNPHGT